MANYKKYDVLYEDSLPPHPVVAAVLHARSDGQGYFWHALVTEPHLPDHEKDNKTHALKVKADFDSLPGFMKKKDKDGKDIPIGTLGQELRYPDEPPEDEEPPSQGDSQARKKT